MSQLPNNEELLHAAQMELLPSRQALNELVMWMDGVDAGLVEDDRLVAASVVDVQILVQKYRVRWGFFVVHSCPLFMSSKIVVAVSLETKQTNYFLCSNILKQMRTFYFVSSQALSMYRYWCRSIEYVGDVSLFVVAFYLCQVRLLQGFICEWKYLKCIMYYTLPLIHI